MLSPSAEPELMLNPGTRLLSQGGRIVICLGHRQLSAEIAQFPWDLFFELCSHGAITAAKLRVALIEAGADAIMTDAVVSELISHGVLCRVEESVIATMFHQASSIGYYDEPVPPFHLASNDSLPSDAYFLEGWKIEHRVNALNLSFGETLRRRSSKRQFGNEALPIKCLETILWAAYGWMSSEGRCSVPSAGALYPLRLMVLALPVEGLDEGLYAFAPWSDRLERRPALQGPPTLSQWLLAKHVDYDHVAVVIFFVARFDGICPVYGERGYRYLLLEAGHAAQNLCLAATALSVPHVPIGAFDDDQVNVALCRPGYREATVYTIVLGCM